MVEIGGVTPHCRTGGVAISLDVSYYRHMYGFAPIEETAR